jgi:hypothetical protein
MNVLNNYTWDNADPVNGEPICRWRIPFHPSAAKDWFSR